MDQKALLCEKAVKRFLEGYNCAQSVLSTMCEFWNIKSELVPKIATPFGGGIGLRGSVCGALTGGVMAIGIKHGANEPSAKKHLKAYELAGVVYTEFQKRHGTVLCRELIGYNLSDPKDLEKAGKAGVFEKKCVGFVKTMVEMLAEINEH
ncbi:MAG: C-GCAxxG-C-C family protein [Candidatus Bathyarchaeales archaeon]